MMFSSEKSNPASANRNKREPNNINKSRSVPTTPRHAAEDINESSSSSTSSSSNDSSQNYINTNNKKANYSFNSDYNINTSNEFQLVEMNKKTYENMILNIPKGYRTILLVLAQENKNLIIDLFTNICSKYAK